MSRKSPGKCFDRIRSRGSLDNPEPLFGSSDPETGQPPPRGAKSARWGHELGASCHRCPFFGQLEHFRANNQTNRRHRPSPSWTLMGASYVCTLRETSWEPAAQCSAGWKLPLSKRRPEGYTLVTRSSLKLWHAQVGGPTVDVSKARCSGA